eukprot:12065361-Ditylum_brightwellii.AAC.1
MVSACAPGPAGTASHKPAGVRAQLHEQSYWAHYVEAVQYFHPVLWSNDAGQYLQILEAYNVCVLDVDVVLDSGPYSMAVLPDKCQP